MICVYKSNETNFNNNGLAVLDKCIKAEVEETLNGDYTLTLEYPVIENKSKYLIKDNVIKAPTPRGLDYFTITKQRRNTKSIEVIARHISYELDRNGLTDVRPTNLNGLNALNWMKDRLQYTTRFNFSSDINKLGTAYYERKNFLEAIMGNDNNSFFNVWGGELDRNKFQFNILTRLGADRGYKIEDGKNLLGVEETTEGQEVTRIYPTGRNENDTVLPLPEQFIDSPLINNYPTPSVKYIDFSDLKVSNDANSKYKTADDVYKELRRQVNLMYTEQHIDRPSINFSVDFLDRKNLRENKELQILQQLYLGDTVTIFSKKLNINIKARLRKYTFNSIREVYTALELGDFVKSEYSTSAILNNKIEVNQIENSSLGNKIKEALGGYVLKRENEILIMDTSDISTAKNVWRWDLNGLGYSSTGYNGNYNTAITMDGEISANFIKTGILLADLIKAGILESKNNKTFINMEDGTFNFADRFAFDGTDMYFKDGSLVVKDINNAVIAYFARGTNWMHVQGLEVFGLGDSMQSRGEGSRSLILASTTAAATDNLYLTFLNVTDNSFCRILRKCVDDFLTVEGGGLIIQGIDTQDGRLEVRAGQNSGQGGNAYIDFCTDAVNDYTNRLIVKQGTSAIECTGDFQVSGQKNAVVDTENYGRRLINSYETTEVFFGDIGESKIDETGICTIEIDTIFLECVNTDHYHVFTQVYEGSINKIKRYKDKFIVFGEEGTEFSWEIKAKRLGYENVRLQESAPAIKIKK